MGQLLVPVLLLHHLLTGPDHHVELKGRRMAFRPQVVMVEPQPFGLRQLKG